MTVYVDNAGIQATVGRYRARWSHLLTDDPTHAELHELAGRIGLRRDWFQGTSKLGDPFRWWQCHYDVTGPKRREAITAGAVAIDWREWAEMAAKFKALKAPDVQQ